ncbi:uncharacterized protein V1510DRAFT_419109 [Dipodascopsis tothii]|uniref:uncharacterized protein n=1 Tax=Dipodascopsis tothii TaxID=44089 RepID=UPI0034CE985B
MSTYRPAAGAAFVGACAGRTPAVIGDDNGSRVRPGRRAGGAKWLCATHRCRLAAPPCAHFVMHSLPPVWTRGSGPVSARQLNSPNRADTSTGLAAVLAPRRTLATVRGSASLHAAISGRARPRMHFGTQSELSAATPLSIGNTKPNQAHPHHAFLSVPRPLPVLSTSARQTFLLYNHICLSASSFPALGFGFTSLNHNRICLHPS